MIQLKNDFRVTLPVWETWELLTDLPRVARCLPGANLDEVVDGEYRGGLSAKIGPINAKYRGTASFLELDEVEHRAVIAARGREEKGSGSATANITAVLTPDGDGTLVKVVTDLAVSGRAAQFGRSLMAEVSGTMIGEFVRRLEDMIQNGDAQATAQTNATVASRNGSAPAPSRASASLDDEPNQLNVGTTLLLPMLRKAAVPIATAAIAGVLGMVLGRYSGRRARRSAGGHLLVPDPAFGASSQLFRLVPIGERTSRSVD